MNKKPAPHLSHAGYLILLEPDTASVSNEYRRGFGDYFGVDRLPLLFPPDACIREAIGERPIQEASLQALLGELFDSRYGDTAFIPSGGQASRLWTAFRALGFKYELVYCQLAWKEGEEDRLNAYVTPTEALPVSSLLYGWDVSWPGCNHSAILQPGLVTASWKAKRNRYGLLDEYEDAAKLRAEYLAIYPYPPFDIYLVHGSEKRDVAQIAERNSLAVEH